MAGEGFKLVISKEELRRIEQADKRIEMLGTNAEQARDKVIAAFKQMIKEGVDPFSKAVRTAAKDVKDLKTADASLKTFDEAIKKTGKTSKETAKSLSDLLTLFSAIKTQTSFDPTAGLKSLNVGQAEQQLKSLKALLSDPKLNLDDKDSDFLRRRIEVLTDYKKQAVKSEQTITAEHEAELKKREAAEERANAKREKEAKRVAREVEKAEREAEKMRQQELFAKNTTFEGSVAFSKTAKSINEEKEAIQYLTIARDNLNKSDKNYGKQVEELNRRILQHKINIDKTTRSSNMLKDAHMGILRNLGPLGNKLALVFSVSAITGYVKQMMNVRAEFELQNRALQAILQNKEQADALFERITALAVRSPYRVKELVTYTKQLAAYRVEEEKLYDTTKMLADVSSGLGVDMQRLILAYGQVKAANYLRGQELRQFSEAGINILGELADYFSELEGRAITTGEVFERVSKRMVTFEDVAEIFKRITEEGGIFYNMQEIQAETLRGQISNLRDSIDIMFNEIGKANEGVLKNSVKLIRNIVENWESMARAAHAVGIAYALYTVKVLIAAAAQGKFNAEVIDATIAMGGLEGALGRVWKIGSKLFTKAGLIGVIITVLGLVINRIIQVRKEMNQADKAFDEMNKKIGRSREAIAHYTPELARLAKEQKELTESSKNDKDTQEKLNTIREKQKKLLGELAEVDATYANGLKGKLGDEQALVQAAKDYNDELETRLRLQGSLNKHAITDKKEEGFWGKVKAFFGGPQSIPESFDEAEKEFNDATQNIYDNWEDYLNKLEKFINDPYSGYEHLSEQAKKAFADLLIPSDETRIQKAEKLFDAMSNFWMNDHQVFEYNVHTFYKDITEFGKARQKYNDVKKELSEEIPQALSETVGEPYLQSLYSAFLGTEDEALKNKYKDQIIDFYEETLSQLTPVAREYAEQYLLTIFDFGKWQKSGEKALDYLRRQMVQYLKDNNLQEIYGKAIFTNITPDTLPADYFKNLEDMRKSLLDEAKRARAATQSMYEGISNVAQAEKLEATAEAIERMRNAFGYFTEDNASKALNQFKQRLQLLQDMYKKYMDLRKNFTEEESKQKVKESYGSVFKDLFGSMGWNINNFDFTTLQGVLRQLGMLENQAKKLGKDAQRELHDAMGDTEVQIDVKVRQDSREELQRDIADMFDGYDLALEMEKLDVPAELAQQLFGISATTLPQMRQLMEQWKSEGRFIGEESEKIYKDTLEKIDDMQDKADKEALKRYVTYLNDATDKRITIKREELRKLREIEAMDIPASQKSLMREGVKKEAQKELDKQAWDQFKESDLYIQMFENLEKASVKSLAVMRDQLEEMRTNLNDLDPTNAKQIEKIEEVMHNRHPLRYLNDDLKQASEYIANREVWENALAKAMKQASNIARRKEEAIDFAMDWEKTYREFADQGREWEAMISYGEWQRALQEVEKLGKEYENVNKQVDDYTRKLSKGQRALQNYTTTLTQMVDWLKEFNNLMEEVYVLSIQTWGSGTSSAEEYARIIGDAAENVANLAQSIIKIVASEGADISSWIQAGASLAGIWKNINQFIDQGKIDAINEQQRAVDNLAWAYSRLEEQLENALLLEDALVDGNQMLTNIELRRQAIEAELAAEQDRKDPDEDHINDLKRQLIELGDEAENAKSKIIEAFGGIGSSNYASEAANIVNAWVDAYKNGENTLDAVNGKFDEFIDNLIKKQAALRFGNRYLERLFTDMDDMFDENGMINYNTLNEFNEKYKNSIGGFNEGMRQFMETLGLSQGYASQNLTAMQRGIQGVTEKEAEVIESYLNGVRSNQMDMKNEYQKTYTWLVNPANPILTELKRQSESMESMEGIIRRLDSAIVPNPSGGNGTKAVNIVMK